MRAFKKVAFLFCSTVLAAGCLLPSEQNVKSEFLDRYPESKIYGMELIFEQGDKAVYLVTVETKEISEKAKYDFALKRSYGFWSWCDDQTERKCK